MADKKIALVTGAGTGIGRASSLALMKAGFTWCWPDGARTLLEETAKTWQDRPARAWSSPTDMRKPASIAALFAKTMEAYGRLDVLFNNAGVGTPPVPLEDLSARAVADARSTPTSPRRSCARSMPSAS